MKVPEEIRRVKRPKNTVVECTGRAGNNMYPVRERSSVKYVKGGNPQPHNGKVIGHIIDFKFVAVDKKDTVGEPVIPLSYGAPALIHAVSSDIFEDLLSCFSVKTATTIMAIAALKIEKPSIKASRLKSRYECSYTSVYYPKAALSHSSVSSLYKSVGQDIAAQRGFFSKRLERMNEDGHILIGGTLKENNSTVNDLSHYSYRSRIKGTQDISVIYAYDLESKEPLCCEVFPGNHVDASAYANFVAHNNIRKGIIVDDKGFPVKKISDALRDNPELHFLTPIKRNDTRISDNNMYEFDEVITGISENVLARKKKLRGGNYLYAFLDSYKAGKEMTTLIEKAKTSDSFNASSYAEKERRFGTIVLESDLDMTCREAYLSYTERWELELLFKAYKSELKLNTVNVQNDFSVFGSEFVNFISVLITRRIIDRMISVNLLAKDTYGDLIDDLSMAWRDEEHVSEKPDSTDTHWVHVNVGVMDIMKKLDLCK